MIELLLGAILGVLALTFYGLLSIDQNLRMIKIGMREMAHDLRSMQVTLRHMDQTLDQLQVLVELAKR